MQEVPAVECVEPVHIDPLDVILKTVADAFSGVLARDRRPTLSPVGGDPRQAGDDGDPDEGQSGGLTSGHKPAKWF